ncbi:DUF1636 family protein [Cognatishimia maritima]|uniref:Predicted metal-binding protein n=1 Tax=Cognatishimia maritima TaxID=870908 RepID=A0A1M5NEE4_9RHOB|nr:DUF1636 family protein [Cognatishimia maritima]SHG87549.1 Predicted metal-binding protein [Cognatishimia maritima]
MTEIVFICATCQMPDGAKPGPAFAKDLAQKLSSAGVTVQLVDCLNMCDAPLSLALRAPGKTAYLFSDLRPDDIEDAAALARLYKDAKGGEITDARPAGRLRHCLVGRIPSDLPSK